MSLEICPKSLSPYFRSFVNQPGRCASEKVYARSTWERHRDCSTEQAVRVFGLTATQVGADAPSNICPAT